MSSVQSRILRYSLIAIGTLFAILLIVLTLITLAIYTEAGSRRVTHFLIERANQLDGIQLQSESISGNLLNGLTLGGFSAELSGVAIAAVSVHASWNPYSVLSGSFYLSELGIVELEVTLPATDPAAAPTDVLQLLRIAPLPINVTVATLGISRLRVSLPDQTIEIDSLDLAAELSGNELLIENLHVERLPLVLDIGLQTQLADNIPIAATINWEYRGELFADYQLAVGRTAVTGDLTRLTIQHELLSPEAIHSSGTINHPTSGDLLSLSFTHQTDNLRLPLAGLDTLLFDNVSVTTNFSGTGIGLELQSGVTQAEIPPLQIAATGVLDGSALTLTSATISSDTGTANLSGDIDWSDLFQGSIAFSVEDSSPLRYLPSSLPVNLSEISTSGLVTIATVNEQSRIDVAIDDFTGITSGYNIAGQANISIIDSAVQIQSLQLNTEANSIAVTGEYQDQIRLDWQLDAPVLEQLLADTQGIVTGSGEVRGDLDNPQIAATLSASSLQHGNLAIGNLDFSVNGSLSQLHSNALISNMTLQSADTIQLIDLLQLEFDGSTDSHTARASLESSYGDAVFTITGGIDDLADLVWQGTLDEASIQSEFGLWEKSPTPSPLTLSASTILMPEACWLMAQTQLCVEASQSGSSRVDISAALSRFPLTEFTNTETLTSPLIAYPSFPRLPTGLSLDGQVSAQINGQIDLVGGLPQFDFAVIANEAVLTIANTESVDPAIADELQDVDDQRYQWDTLSLTGQLLNNAWSLAGTATLSQQNIDGSNLGLHGEIESRMNIGNDGRLDGSVNANFAELGWIQAFVPELSAVSGSLISAINISGTLSAPLLAGESTLREGSADLARLGVALRDIQANVTAQTTGQVQLAGSLSSGEGTLSFAGDIANLFESSRSLQARLNGSDILLADIPNIKLSVSPDISMSMDSNLIQLDGSLHIPILDLTLLELPATAADISRDAVVVNYPANQPELAYSVASSQNRLFDTPIAADINLTLGDSVDVSGFGMKANLDGNLSIQQRADGRNLTYGELTITEGTYGIYGQTLDLRQGKLLFFGAIDNPALDIRAVREAENVTVGVLMNGTLKNIRSQLFSTPTLPDNDIIAVLVTGRPYSELGEQDGTAVLGTIAALGLDRGEGLTDQIRNTLGLDTLGINSTGNINSSVLTIGKYLTPDIFIRYGVGLFDHESKVAIDYSLTPRIILQAESGEYQSIDLTYTIER